MNKDLYNRIENKELRGWAFVPFSVLYSTFFILFLSVFILYSLFAILPSVAHASGVLGNFNMGMVGYWPLEEGSGAVARDTSGGGNTATLTSSSWTTAGKFGKALSFGGSPQIASTSLSWPTSGSISLWVYPTSYSDWVSPAGWKLLGGNQGYILIDEGGAGGTGRWRAVFKPDNAGTETAVVALQNITQNSWQHVVMSWSKVGSVYTVTLYVNNVLQGSNTWSGTPGAGGVGHFHFGNSGDYPDNYFLGKVDDVRVYNYAMTPAQVGSIYKVGVPAATIGHSSNVPLSSGLVGYWPFDGNTTNWLTGTTRDLSNNSINGSLVGLSTTTSSVAGKIGGALKFSSASAQEVSLGTTPANITFAYNQPFSISLWAKASATVGSGVFNRMVSTSATSNRFEYFVMASNNAFSFNVGKNGIGDASVAGPTFVLGQWYHLIGVYNGTNINFYINGVSVGTAAYTYGALSNPDGILSIGGGGAAGNTFDGSIDDVRIYNRALSAAEAAQLYKNGGSTIAQSSNTSSMGGLVGYWTFDGPKINWATGAVTDSSGQGNTGALVSMSTSSSPVAGKVGQALKFNGSSSYVSNGNASTFALSSGTVSAWVKTSGCTGSGGYCGIIVKQNAYGFFLKNNVLDIYDWNASADRNTGVNIADGRWHHLVEAFNSGVANGTTLYIDGVPRLTTSMSVVSQVIELEIGRGGTTSGGAALQYMNGSIDDVRIYNRTLSASEVAQLYSSTR